MAARPRAYRWSSHRRLALGAADAVVTPHPLYRALGRSEGERQEAYRALFREALEPTFLDGLRAATNGGWALGDAKFRARIAAAAGRRAAPLSPGRPAAEGDDPRQLNLL
jgi:putative transposase